MFFFLSKILDVFLSPLTWALLFVGGGLALRRHPARSALCTLLGMLTLYVFSLDPVANALWRPMETPPLTTMQEGAPYDVVIVLSGMIDESASEAQGHPAFNDNVERLLAAFDLLRTNRARSVLLSGGSGRIGGGAPEADYLAAQLRDWGIAPDRIYVEEKSRNTRENALYSAEVVRAQKWQRLLLVTSAFHMERALGCFRAVGLSVDTLSVDFRSYDSHKHSGSLLPHSGALSVSTNALHERFGRIIYRLRGYSR